MTLIDKNRQRG